MTDNTGNKPIYAHDKTTGTYLGSYKNKDLYFRAESDYSEPILIVKQGDEDWNYFYMPLHQVQESIKNGEIIKNSPYEKCYNLYLEYINKTN